MVRQCSQSHYELITHMSCLFSPRHGVREIFICRIFACFIFSTPGGDIKKLEFEPFFLTVCLMQPNDAVCDPHLHEAPRGESEGASRPRAQTGAHQFPAQD